MLDGLRILDLTSNLPGPVATWLLSDLGAEVIKIERPPRGDDFRWSPGTGREESVRFGAVARGKKSLVLNLKSEAGRDIFYRLVKTADAVFEGFRPGVIDRLGLGYDRLAELRPGLILVSISGYGQDGPLRERAGHDLDYQALAGLAGLTGDLDGRPTLPGMQPADLFGGSALAVIGFLAALRRRDKTGQGAWVDTSMLDGVFSMVGCHLAAHLAEQEDIRPGRGALNGGLACYQIYPTADGRHLAVGALEPHFWAAFCRAIGQPELIDRVDGGREVIDLVAGVIASQPLSHWAEVFTEVDCCVEPVLTPAEAVEHPQNRHRGLAQWLETPQGRRLQPGCPIVIDGQRPGRVAPPPELGQHNRDLLAELGLTEADLAELESAGVIGSGKSC